MQNKPRTARRAASKSRAVAKHGTGQDDASMPVEHPPNVSSEPTYVVGVGASAGGLEALCSLFAAYQPNGLCFVVLQHLSPERESILPGLLARLLHIQVVKPVNGMLLRRDQLYVVPPNQNATIVGKTLRLTPRQAHPPDYRPIDVFFHTLARAKTTQAIGIILSGAGSDGSKGLRAIRDGGGITFVQHPDSAKYDSMPSQAKKIASPDFCLSPARIAEELARIAHRADSPRDALNAQTQQLLHRVIALLRMRTGVDFGHYKDKTLERRLIRRSAVKYPQDLAAYVDLLESDGEERRGLVEEMLVGATSFFRNKSAFFCLNKTVLPAILAGKKNGQVLRIWSVGCSTGEEAYSLAICAMRAIARCGTDVQLQVFATDLSELSIAKARKGRYEIHAIEGVPVEIRGDYFTEHKNIFTVTRELRDKIIFSRQNALSDPPFSTIDLVVCRNVLIYLQPSAQQQLLRTLHFSLTRTGYLLLGDSETIGDAPDLFALHESQARFYKKQQERANHAGPAMPQSSAAYAYKAREGAIASRDSRREGLDSALLRQFVEPGVVLDESLNIVEVRGNLQKFLRINPGSASLKLQRFLPAGLQMSAKRLVEKAFTVKEPVLCYTPCTVDDSLVPICLAAAILPIEGPSKNFVYLRFGYRHKELMSPPPSRDRRGGKKDAKLHEEGARGAQRSKHEAMGRYITDLERELQVLRDHLDQVADDHSNSVQELHIRSEEAQSSNEELRCANEELETTKEEIQSANEELTVVNEEMQNNLDELGLAHEELHTLLVHANIIAYFVGLDMRLRRYSEAAAAAFDLNLSDIGRPTDYVCRMFEEVNLHKMTSQAIDHLRPVRQVIRHVSGEHFLMNIFPSKTLQNTITGALLTFEKMQPTGSSGLQQVDDGPASKEVTQLADAQWLYHRTSMMILDKDLRFVWGNQQLYAKYQQSESSLAKEVVTSGPLKFLFDEEAVSVCREVLADKEDAGPPGARNRAMLKLVNEAITLTMKALPLLTGRYLLVTVCEVTDEDGEE